MRRSIWQQIFDPKISSPRFIPAELIFVGFEVWTAVVTKSHPPSDSFWSGVTGLEFGLVFLTSPVPPTEFRGSTSKQTLQTFAAYTSWLYHVRNVHFSVGPI